MFGHHKKTKKDKKKEQQQRNRHLLMLQQLAGLNQANVEREDVSIGAPKIERKPKLRDRSPTKQEADQKSWSGQLQQIRDRNTGHRRAAVDRFNRMAGTADAGARGR